MSSVNVLRLFIKTGYMYICTCSCFGFARKTFDDSGVQENLEEDARLTALLEAILWNKQPLPPLSLASGMGALSDKFQTVMMALFLVGAGITSETRVSTYIAFVKSVIACTGDTRLQTKQKQQTRQEQTKHKQHKKATWA